MVLRGSQVTTPRSLEMGPPVCPAATRTPNPSPVASSGGTSQGDAQEHGEAWWPTLLFGVHGGIPPQNCWRGAGGLEALCNPLHKGSGSWQGAFPFPPWVSCILPAWAASLGQSSPGDANKVCFSMGFAPSKCSLLLILARGCRGSRYQMISALAGTRRRCHYITPLFLPLNIHSSLRAKQTWSEGRRMETFCLHHAI